MRIGTERESITPCPKAIRVVSLSVLFAITPSIVSIEVAPPIDAAPRGDHLATKGIRTIAKISLITFAVKEMAPRTGE